MPPSKEAMLHISTVHENPYPLIKRDKGDKEFSKLDFEKDIIQIYTEHPITYRFQ